MTDKERKEIEEFGDELGGDHLAVVIALLPILMYVALFAVVAAFAVQSR